MSVFRLESFNLSALPCLPLSDKSNLPSCAAVYLALSAQGKVLYVGQSIDIRERLRRHHRVSLLEALGGVRIAWLQESHLSALRRIETALIEHFNPPINGIPSFFKQEDIENLTKYLAWNDCNVKSNVIPINQLLTPRVNQTNELANQREIDSKLQSLSEFTGETSFELQVVLQAERIKHLEQEIVDLRLMFQEQMQVCRQMTDALVEQAKVISELSRTQLQTNSRKYRS